MKPVPSILPERCFKDWGRPRGKLTRGAIISPFSRANRTSLPLSPISAELAKLDCIGIIASARGDASDFVSRFFAPRAGVPEDPVTGSSHTLLIPFWAKRLDTKKLHAFQISRRRGELFCEFLGERVLIGGRAVTFLTGEIRV